MSDTKPLTDNQIASIWVRYEETGSMRQTARALGIALATVQKYLAQDPHRLRSLRSAQEEERAAKWQQVEEHSIDALISGCQHVKTILKKARSSWRKEDRLNLTILARTIAASRLVADTGCKQVQVLSGGVTDRTASLSASTSPERGSMSEEVLYEALMNVSIAAPPGMVERFRGPDISVDSPPAKRVANPPTPPKPSKPAPPAKKKRRVKVVRRSTKT